MKCVCGDEVMHFNPDALSFLRETVWTGIWVLMMACVFFPLSRVQERIFGIPVKGLKVRVPKGRMWMVLSIPGNHHNGSDDLNLTSISLLSEVLKINQRLSMCLDEKVTGWFSFSCKALQKSEGRAKTGSPCCFGHETPYITLLAQITIGGGGA